MQSSAEAAKQQLVMLKLLLLSLTGSQGDIEWPCGFHQGKPNHNKLLWVQQADQSGNCQTTFMVEEVEEVH
jgi:hypothetical protein